ncbi:MAG: MBOAT family protein [Bacilli bacterium]|nr:MBOAT family protein [Bacilli bacterium]
MVFTSITFLYYFLPIVLLIYFITPYKYRNGILLLSSLIFYFYGEPKYILLMIFEVLLAYFSMLIVSKSNNKLLYILTIIIHILLLCIFKYLNFVTSNINSIFNINLPLSNIILPIGISFYTFQIISYEIDVYKKRVNVQKNLLKLATYIFMFPQLIAGPIVRYSDIEHELDKRKHSFDNFSYGVERFMIGLFKKVLIANTLGELSNILITSTDISILLYWIFAVSYMLQIYFDFSGYSDIAIGLGRMFGFHFLENFNYPYMATSITDFWRRWHISLSSWFRDYIYIPLGGNRKGVKKQIRNILIVWLLTGLWHGANYTFIVWGLLFGIMLIIEKFILSKYLKNTPYIIKRIYTLFIVLISFVIFRADNINEAFNIIKGLFGFNTKVFSNSFTIYYLKSYFIILLLGIILSTPLLSNIITRLRKNNVLNKIINLFEPLLIILILVLVTACLIDNSYNPFLYFRF